MRLCTIFYTAPEVFEGEYDMRCDVWSIGVILFSLLAKGKLPFGKRGVPPHVVYKKISTKPPAFSPRKDWDAFSGDAVRFIERLLTKDYRARPTATDALKDSWFEHQNISGLAAYGDDILVLLARFKQMNDLKKLTHQLIAKELTQAEVGFLQQQYRLLDTDGDGNITVRELLTAINALEDNQHSFDDDHFHGQHTPRTEPASTLDTTTSSASSSSPRDYSGGVSPTTTSTSTPGRRTLSSRNHAALGLTLDRRGGLNVPVESEEDVVLDIDEFIAATFRHQMPLREEQVRAAFQKFDRQNRGEIHVEDLYEFFRSRERAEEVFAAVDQDRDGAISFDEFQRMMDCGPPEYDLLSPLSNRSTPKTHTSASSLGYDRQTSPTSSSLASSATPYGGTRRTSTNKTSKGTRLSAHSRIARYASSKLSRRYRASASSGKQRGSPASVGGGGSYASSPTGSPVAAGRPVSASFVSRIL